jgi:hypothetical protein
MELGAFLWIGGVCVCIWDFGHFFGRDFGSNARNGRVVEGARPLRILDKIRMWGPHQNRLSQSGPLVRPCHVPPSPSSFDGPFLGIADIMKFATGTKYEGVTKSITEFRFVILSHVEWRSNRSSGLPWLCKLLKHDVPSD